MSCQTIKSWQVLAFPRHFRFKFRPLLIIATNPLTQVSISILGLGREIKVLIAAVDSVPTTPIPSNGPWSSALTLLSRQSQHASAGGKVSFLSPGWALVSPLHDSQLSNIYHSMCQVKILISSGKGWIKYKRTKQNTATVRGQQTYSLCLWINIFWWLLLCNEGRVE